MIDLRIFVSSPHDVGNERGVCGTVVSRLQLEFRGLVRLQAIFWENELLRPDQTFQSQIPRASEADACIFILWSWFGTPLPAAVASRADGTTYLSGTEFEFEDAMASRRARGTPDIFVYRKVADVPVSVRSRDVELMQRSQRDALDGFLEKWFRGEGGTFKAAFYEFEHPAGFERLLETHLRRWIIEELEKAGVAEAAVHREAQWKGSPFRGLRPFDIDDALIFCGRTQAVTELLDLLRGRAAAGRPFALVVGRSGAGKSSLVRAGLLPMLTQPEVVQGVIAWRRAVFRPSDVAGRPVDALAAAILSPTALPEIGAGGTGVAELAKLLGENPAAATPLIRLALARVGDTARAALPSGAEGDAQLAVVIDQFEEIFTQEGVQSADRGAFVGALHALAGTGQVWVVATMRADFYPRCQDLPPVFLELSPREAVFELMPPTPEEISQMIRRPARLAGLDFEKRTDQEQGLDDVLRDAAIANPGGLPLLQFALEELYTRAGQGRLLRFADYEEMGRLQGALQVRADTELKALSEDAQAALPLVLSHLVQLDLKTGAIAQRRLSYARVASDPHCRALIDWFVDKRLFERDRGSDGETVVGVAHEALLRSWKRAQDWIEHNQSFLRLRARIAAAEVLWREEGRPERLLLPEGRALKDAEALKLERGAELGPAELAYIEQSLALARRVRLWRRMRALAATAAIVMIGAAGAWYYWAYVMPVSAYYEDYEIRWGFPEGRAVLSADTASHRRATYRLTRRGALGHVVKLETLNGRGRCQQTNDGVTPFGESADGDDYTSKVQCSVEFEESGGRLVREIARDRTGREIFTLGFIEWSEKRAQAQYWVGDRLRPEISGAVVIHYEFADQGPDAGLLTHKWFTDATNDAKPNKDGIFGFSYKYEHGRVSEEARLDKDGKPIDLNKKASLWRTRYDENGHLSEMSYYNRSGAKMIGADGYARIEYSYDRFGNETAETYYDLNDRLIGQTEEDSGGSKSAGGETPTARDKKADALPMAKWTASYDQYGNQTEIKRLDWRGQLVHRKVDAAQELIDYDAQGRRIQHRYLDENSQPTPDSDGDLAFKVDYDAAENRSMIRYLDGDLKPVASGKREYASVRYDYDARGNETDETYLAIDGRPTHNADGIGRIHYEYVDNLESEAIWFNDAGPRAPGHDRYSRRHTDYDRYGRVSEYHYYDTQDRPMRPPASAATIRVLYDQNGNRISRVTLDEHGNPVDLDGWAEWIDEFDRENRRVRTLYFNAAGRPATGPDKYAIASWRYDDDGNKVRAEYLGPDWKPVAGPDGYALLTWTFDKGVLAESQMSYAVGTSVWARFDAQGHEIETRYLDSVGRPRVDDEVGCARVVRTYRPDGFLTDVSYFDVKDHLCVAKGSHYARMIRTQKDAKTSLAIYEDASGAPTTSNTGAKVFQWTEFDTPSSGEARHVMPGGSIVVVLFSSDLIVDQQHYNAAGEPTDYNDFKAYRVTFAYGSDKKIAQRVLYRTNGVEVRERWSNGVPAEMDYVDQDGNPTDRNDFEAMRVVFVNDDAGNMQERVRYRAHGLVQHERFDNGKLAEIVYTDANGNLADKGDVPVYRTVFKYAATGEQVGRADYHSDGTVERQEMIQGKLDESWTDASGKLVNGERGFARCEFGNDQSICTDREGRKLVPVIAIEDVQPGTTADYAKLKSGDLLINYDGEPISNMDAFRERVVRPGMKARLLIIARDGKRLSFSVPPGLLGIVMAQHYVLPTQLGAP